MGPQMKVRCLSRWWSYKDRAPLTNNFLILWETESHCIGCHESHMHSVLPHFSKLPFTIYSPSTLNIFLANFPASSSVVHAWDQDIKGFIRTVLLYYIQARSCFIVQLANLSKFVAIKLWSTMETRHSKFL